MGELCALIEPHYPKAGNGRPPVGLERMLRIYFLQQWFNLSDPAVEEALYDSMVMRDFVGIDLGREPVPDETTVCKFRHLLEEHQLGGEMLADGKPAPPEPRECGSRQAGSWTRPSFMRPARPTIMRPFRSQCPPPDMAPRAVKSCLPIGSA